MYDLWLAAENNLDKLEITMQIWVGMALFVTFFAMAMRPPMSGTVEMEKDQHKIPANPFQ